MFKMFLKIQKLLKYNYQIIKNIITKIYKGNSHPMKWIASHVTTS